VKFGIISDLHQEFAPYDFQPEDGVFYLNAGDTQSHTKERQAWLGYYDDIMFSVLGNHDFFLSTDQPEDIPDVREVDGVKIAGATMWTKITDYTLWTLYQNRMIDCTFIKDWTQLRYQFVHTTHLHHLLTSGADIIVTHHAPSFMSLHPRHSGDLNFAFAVELYEQLHDMHNPPKLWVHGHSHDPVDYVIGKTRVLSHPRGYTHEWKTFDNYSPLVIDF
jgi:hypothetical protein